MAVALTILRSGLDAAAMPEDEDEREKMLARIAIASPVTADFVRARWAAERAGAPRVIAGERGSDASACVHGARALRSGDVIVKPPSRATPSSSSSSGRDERSPLGERRPIARSALFVERAAVMRHARAGAGAGPPAPRGPEEGPSLMEPVGIVLATQISALDEEARRIEAAPLPLAEALTRLEEQRRTVAARITARRAERVRGFFSPKGVTHLDDLYGLPQGFGRQGRELEDAIREALDARFLADVAEWQKAIKAATIPGDPMPVAERAPRLAQLARDRVELERQEERLVMCAERDGLQLDRRETADPAVVVTTVFATDAAA